MDCLLVCDSQAAARQLRTLLAPIGAQVAAVWSCRQLVLGQSVGTAGGQSARLAIGRPLDAFGQIVFCGFPALLEHAAWGSMTADEQFAHQEYSSALSSVLLLSPARLVNRSLLRRGGGFPLGPALALRLLSRLGWDLGVTHTDWSPDQRPPERPAFVTTYRLWVTPLNHCFDDYLDLKFPDDLGVDAKIRRTQDFLRREEFACCMLELATDGQELRLVHATLGQMPLDVSASCGSFLMEGIVT